jgi:hypothetical protein
MSKQSEYTFNVHSEFLRVPPTVVTITATSIEDANDKMWEGPYKYKATTLTHINGEKYMPEDETYASCPPDPEERYWKNAATCAERFSYDDWD